MLPLEQAFASRTPHAASYYSLGEPGPRIRHVWLCLHGHDQPVADLAAQLVHLDTPERLLILPAAPTPAPAPGHSAPAETEPTRWFRPGFIGPDLAQGRAFLDQLTEHILVACPPGTPLTVLGYGHGATAASAWLVGNRFPYERLIFYAAVFPPEISRARLFADLPRSPVAVVATTADTFTPEADGAGLLHDLHHAGLPAWLSRVDEGPLTLAALGAGGEPDGLLPRR